jgi:hypothetical protein
MMTSFAGRKGRTRAQKIVEDRRNQPTNKKVKPKRVTDSIFARIHEDKMWKHMAALRARGLDPDFIGEHEVEPIRCGGCGKIVPWKDIKGHR